MTLYGQITPLLVSQEEGTVKTKFLELMAEIYKGNSNILNYEQFNVIFSSLIDLPNIKINKNQAFKQKYTFS